MVYFMDNPTKMDDLGVPPILGNLHILIHHWIFPSFDACSNV